MQAFAESSTSLIGVDLSPEGTATVATDSPTGRYSPLAFDASAVILALATSLAGPARNQLTVQGETAAVYSTLSWHVFRPVSARKSASDDDLQLDSPNWLGARLAALRASGFHRRYPID